MPEPAEAGPSSRKDGVIDSELVWCTYRDLSEHLEGTRRTRPFAEVQQLVKSRLPKLQKCATPLPPPSSSSQSQLASGKVKLPHGLDLQVDAEHCDLAEKISARFEIDQVESFIYLRSFLLSEDRSLDVLVANTGDQPRSSKAKSSTSTISQHLSDEILDAFTVFLFDEQLYLTRCVSALLRIAEDSYAEYYDIAQSTLPTLATPDFGNECMQRFQALLQRSLPVNIRDTPRYSPFWAKQGLKQQLALLQVVFLLFYGHVTPDAAFTLSVLQIVRDTDLGQHQANEAFFDSESVQLLASVRHLLAFIAIESLDLERAMDGYHLSLATTTQPLPLIESADAIAQALDLLESTQPDPGRSPILLAWSLVLRKVEDALDALQDREPRLPTHLQKLQDVITPDDGGQPISARLASAAFSPQLALFPTMRAMALSPLLSSDSTSSFDVSVASSLAFRAVFKGLLLGITEVIRPEFVPDFDALVSLWEATFDASTTSDLSGGAATGVAALSAQFWDVDYEHETRRAVLDTAGRRWPVQFRPLIRLLKALTGTCGRAASTVDNKAALRVLQHFGSVTTLAQVLPSATKSLRPPWEVIESADYSVLDYRAVQSIPLFGNRVVIKPGTCGRMVSELGKHPVVVVWDLQDDPISGWRLVRDVLASFVRLLPDSSPASRLAADDPFGASSSRPVADFSTLCPDDAGDNATVAAEILELFAAVLAGAPDQAAQLLDHLDSSAEADDPDESIESGVHPAQPSLVAVTQRILDQALSTQQDMPTRLVSSAYRLLALLMPYRPTEIWLALRSSNLITGSSGQASWTKQSAAFNTPSSLLTYECSRGSFQGLHSLLELHTNLLSELQRSQFAISPDLLRIKVDVLLRGINWICESIWPEHQSWRFAKALDKLSVGTSCTRILLEIISDTTLAKGVTREIQDAVTGLLVSHAALLHLAPLVNSLAIGQEALGQYHRSGNHAEAEKAHELTRASLQLARHIIERRQDLSTHGALPDRLGLLERMFFDGSAVAVRSLPSGSRRSSRVEMISTVFAYLSQGLSIDLCREASLLITSICLSTTPKSPATSTPSLSLVGHLGTIDEVRSAMGSILDLLDNTHQDVELRAITWTMVAAIVQTQPALAAMLLAGTGLGGQSTNDDFGAKPKADARSEEDKKTALRIAADAVVIWEAYWEGEDVVLLDALLHFLNSVWAQPENSSALESVRSNDAFWKAVTAIVTAKVDAPPQDPPAGFVEQEGADVNLLRTENHDAVRSLSYRMTSKARALYILSSEMETARSTSGKPPASVEHATKLVNQGNDFTATLESVVKFDCDPALHTDVESRMASTFPEVPLSILRNPPKRNEFDLRRAYGDEYVYSIQALRRKLEGFCEGDGDVDAETQVNERVIQQAVLLVSSINLDWSLVDSQAATLRSWTAFLENFSRRVRREHKAQQREREMQKACLQAWTSAAKITVGEEREGTVMSGVHAERVKLLQVLLEAAWGRELWEKHTPTNASKTDDIEQLAEVVHLVQQMLMHNVFTLQGSVRGTERPPFHQELLAVTLLCSRRCRQVVPLSQNRLRESQSSTAHRVIHTSIDAFTSHAVTVLRLIVEKALQLINAGEKGRASLPAAEEELTLVCSLLELLVRSDVSLASHFWLNQLQENAVLPACVTLLRRAPRREDETTQKDIDSTGNITQAPVFMPAILSLFLAMSSQQSAAEQTVLAGLMTALSSNALSPFLESGTVSATSIAANPAHACWVTMLRLVVSIVENIDGDVDGGGSYTATWAAASTRFIEMELMGLVRLYGAQIGRALDFSPLARGGAAGRHDDDGATPISVSQLHELHAVVRLFLLMASADAFAEGSGRGVLATFAQRTTGILQQLIHLIQRPRQLASLLSGESAMDEDSTTQSTQAHHEHSHILTLLSSIASTATAALWHSTRGLSILTSDMGLPSSLTTTAPLLRLTMRTTPAQPASLGTLLDLASYHIERGTDGDTTTIEQSLALAVSQLKLNNSHPVSSKLRRSVEAGIVGDVRSAVESALAAVKGDEEDKEFLRFLLRVCQAL